MLLRALTHDARSTFFMDPKRLINLEALGLDDATSSGEQPTTPAQHTQTSSTTAVVRPLPSGAPVGIESSAGELQGLGGLPPHSANLPEICTPAGHGQAVNMGAQVYNVCKDVSGDRPSVPIGGQHSLESDGQSAPLMIPNPVLLPLGSETSRPGSPTRRQRQRRSQDPLTPPQKMRTFPLSRFRPYHRHLPYATASSQDADVPEEIPGVPDLEASYDKLLREFEAYKAKYLRMGDHSITGSNITAVPLYNELSVSLEKADYIRAAALRIKDQADSFIIDADGVTLRSQICNSAPGGGFSIPHNVDGLVFPVVPTRAVGAQFRELQVTQTIADQVGKFDGVILDHLMNAGVPSEKSVSSALQPRLRLANVNCLRQLGALVEMGSEIFDNRFIYAKLVYYSLLLDISNAVPDAVLLPIEFGEPDIQWINLADPNLPYEAFETAVYNKRIVLFFEEEVGPNDLAAIVWLALGGRRLTGQDGHHAPEGVHTHWPPVPITILGRGAQPVWPGAGPMLSRSLLSLAYKLATKRSEWRDLMRGIYVAMDMIGVRYAGAGGRVAPLKSDLSPRPVTLPSPTDYNFIYRILNVYPPVNPEAQQECETFLRLLPIDRIRVCALYSALYSSFITTVLYGINVNTSLIENWCTGVGTPDIANPIFLSGFNMPGASSMKQDAYVITQAKRGFRLCIGAGVPGDLYAGVEWVGSFGSLLDADMAYIDMIDEITPRLFSPLCVDNWLMVKPLVLGPAPVLTLDKEVILRGHIT